MNVFLLVSKSQLTTQSERPFQPAFENLQVLDLLSTIRNIPDYLGGCLAHYYGTITKY